MSRTLQEMMQNVVLREGEAGKARLSLAINRGTRMIERYIAGIANPGPHAYKLALACGCSEEDALAIAKEGSSAKETA